MFAVAALIAACLSCEMQGDHARGVPSWDRATLASCWNGRNAEVRMMNILSPTMPESEFRARSEWMLGRGCNAAHVLLCNRENGDFAGYSPWGAGKAPAVSPCDPGTVSTMKSRIRRLRSAGFSVVVWVMSDDSEPWAEHLARNADSCIARISEAGLFDDASTVVAGLEMDEYWGASEASAVVRAIRSVYGGKVGVHHTSGRMTFAGMGDILFYQTSPGKSAREISDETRRALSCGVPVNFFELARSPDRTLCEAARKAGAFGVGNW